MRHFSKLIAAIIFWTSTALPASAAVLLSYSGSVGAFSTEFKQPGLLTTPGVLPAANDEFFNGPLAWIATPKPVEYRLTITTPAHPTSVFALLGEDYFAYVWNWQNGHFVQDVFEYQFGTDSFAPCPPDPVCTLPVTFDGDKQIISLIERVNYNRQFLSGSGGFGTAYITYPSDIYLFEDYDPADYGLPFALELSVFAIPEPETWILMVLGFGLLGCALRLRRQKMERGNIVNLRWVGETSRRSGVSILGNEGRQINAPHF